MHTTQTLHSPFFVQVQKGDGRADRTDSKVASGRMDMRTIFVVVGDSDIRYQIETTLLSRGFGVEAFADARSFLQAYQQGRRGCLLVDALMPNMSGIELVKYLRSNTCDLAAIAMSIRFTPPMVVEAMKAGASDCLEQPFSDNTLIRTINKVFDDGDSHAAVEPIAYRSLARDLFSALTARQRDVLTRMTAGHASKNIAADLGISQRTVENHRAAITRKTCSKSFSEVIHKAVCANCSLMRTTQY